MQKELDFILVANTVNPALAFMRRLGLQNHEAAIATNLSWYKKAKESAGVGTRIVLVEDVSENEAYFTAMNDIKDAEYLNSVSDVVRDTDGNPLVYPGTSKDLEDTRKGVFSWKR